MIFFAQGNVCMNFMIKTRKEEMKNNDTKYKKYKKFKTIKKGIN